MRKPWQFPGRAGRPFGPASGPSLALRIFDPAFGGPAFGGPAFGGPACGGIFEIFEISEIFEAFGLFLLVMILLLSPGPQEALAAATERPREGVIKVGEPAPDFTLPDQNGKGVSLSHFRGKKQVVLAYFIKAFTPG